MDKIDQLLKHVTDNCDSILEGINREKPQVNAHISEDDFEDALLEMIEEGTIELVDINGETHYKLTEKGLKEFEGRS
jgi:predicted transcriptional regulator